MKDNVTSVPNSSKRLTSKARLEPSASQDIAVLAGMVVSRGIQQCLVNGNSAVPITENNAGDISINGEKVRIRRPKREVCR